MYLAKIKLRRGEESEALKLFDKSENEANLFPYRYDLLADYFYKNGKLYESERYFGLLIKWIDIRVGEVLSEKFNIDDLEFMNIRSYLTLEFENKYRKMYLKHEKKSVREKLYVEYLEEKKQVANESFKKVGS